MRRSRAPVRTRPVPRVTARVSVEWRRVLKQNQKMKKVEAGGIEPPSRDASEATYYAHSKSFAFRLMRLRFAGFAFGCSG